VRAPVVRPRATERAVVRTLIVDAHEILREGLVRLLTESGQIEVVGEAATGAQALALAADQAPDVVLLDFILPWEDGRVVGVQLRTATNQRRAGRARAVVGADGKYSKVAAWVGAEVYSS
jgi:DNA-binding NarL/FixJ family response regulator